MATDNLHSGIYLMEPDKETNVYKKPKIVYLKNESLYLRCEWGTCQVAKTDMKEFSNHVRSHLREHPADLKCSWADCGFVSYTKEEKTRHVMFHPYHVKLKCLGTRFLERAVSAPPCSMSSLGRNLVPELPDEFVCLWEDCFVSFNDTCEFYDHVNNHVDAYPKGKLHGSVPCVWDGCNGTFENQRRLRDHLRAHTQEKLAACSVCGGLFANRTKFVDHVRRQGIGKKPMTTILLTPTKDPTQQLATIIEPEIFECSHCSKQFSSERLLRDHMRMHVNHYKCPYCDMTTPTPSALNLHVKYRHSDDKPFGCAHCDHKAKSAYDLRRHLFTHSQEVPFKCPYQFCKYETRSDWLLARHTRKIHENGENPNYKCHICERSFSRGTYLTRHLIHKHNYRRPSGHSRFRYKADSDGFYRLQTVRYESIELSQEIADGEDDDIDSEDAPDSDTGEANDGVEPTSSGNVIQLPIGMLQDRQGTLVISFQTKNDGTMYVQSVKTEGNLELDGQSSTDQANGLVALDRNS